jgi:hypothetical protein
MLVNTLVNSCSRLCPMVQLLLLLLLLLLQAHYPSCRACWQPASVQAR